MAKSPQDFYNTHLGRSFDYDGSWGAQCVEGFYAFGRYLGFVIPTGVGSAKYYANSKWQSTLSKWFVYVPASAPLQEGDWVIWPNGTHGHVAMYYQGKSFGQNQHGNGYGHAFTLDTWNFNNRSCAYRYKGWANGQVLTSSGSGGTPSSGFRTYQMSDAELRGLAYLCQREQGSAVGAAKEASLIANRFELYPTAYPTKDTGTLYKYARNSGWWAKSKTYMDNPSPTAEVLAAVKDVIVNGNRKLPNYIDEHDYVGDISHIAPSGVIRNKTNYVKDVTKIYNRMGAYYIFYEWGDESRIANTIDWGGKTDPFGYSTIAKGIATQKGLNGQVGDTGIAGGTSGGTYTPLYSSRNDRNDATFRESAYMTTDGNKTLKSTGVPLSVINYTNAIADQYDSLAASSGLMMSSSGGAAWSGGKVDTSQVTPPMAKQFMEEVLRLGCHPVAACGIAGNIKQECSWDYSLVEGGGSGPGVGICQWTDSERKPKFLRAVPDWRTNFSGQVQYMYKEIQSGFPASAKLWAGTLVNPKDGNAVERGSLRLNYYLPVPIVTGTTLSIDEQSAVAATEVFMCSFERPNTRYAREQVRYDEAKRIFKQLKFIENTSASSTIAQNVSNGIKSLTGEVLTLGSPVTVPSSMQRAITAKGQSISNVIAAKETQDLFNQWKSQGSKSLNNIATLQGYYLVNTIRSCGPIKTIITVTLTSGATFICIVTGHINGSNAPVLQFIRPPQVSEAAVDASLSQLKWKGQNIAKIVSYTGK